MAKLKTNKAILSRLKISGEGKLVRRSTNQSHFNTKTSGGQRRAKRRVFSVNKKDVKNVRKYLPYNK